MELRQRALAALCISDPADKARAATAVFEACRAGAALDPQPDLAAADDPPGLPGRPARPVLVSPAATPRRSPFTTEGRAALLHAVAHIEFNAIKMVYNQVRASRPLPPRFSVRWPNR